MQSKNGRNFALALVLGLAIADTPVAQQNTRVEPPPPPQALEPGQPLEPEVTIRETRSEKIYEYRINGRLVLVRVKPHIGAPYYFVDNDGDGELEYTIDDPTRGPDVNQWMIFQWD